MKLELSIHAINLKNVAGAFKGTSDPYAVVTNMSSSSTTDGGSTGPVVLGKTEMIKNTLNPSWTKIFPIDNFELGTPMRVIVSIFDEVSKGENKAMGSAVFDIGEVLGARGSTKAKRIKAGGTIFATVRKLQGQGVLRFQLKGHKLKNTEGFLRKSDPFFELCRNVNAAGSLTWDNVYRSDQIKDNLDPEWEPAAIELSTLCGGDLNLPIRISVFDYESSGKHVPMGMCETTVQGMIDAATGNVNDLSKALELHVKTGGKVTGKLVIAQAEVSGLSTTATTTTTPSEPEQTEEKAVEEQVARITVENEAEIEVKPTFVDYVRGGCQLNVIVAIDFTGSNGDPRDPNTLHHIGPEKNPYEKAISAIVEILEKYDYNKKFPVYGFGAKYNGVIQHCFPVGEDGEVHGVEGVLKAYEGVFKSGLVMSGPTVFTEVIQTAASCAISAQEAAAAKGEQTYTILLIVTDGAVTDPAATAECLNQVHDAPMSIVIVGVGDADFSSMEFLDDANKAGNRDVVQFVEFNKHSASKSDLTSATLKEIPDQLVRYFSSKNVAPGKPVVARDEEIIVEDEEEEIDLTLDIGEEEIVVTGGGFDTKGNTW